jgi:preprotein translocase subunit YajC
MSQGMSSIILMVVLILMIYFMMIRPQRKKDKADREMRASLSVGDEIITIGGVVGKITKITEKTVIITTGADKTKIEFLKTAIASVSKQEASKGEQKKEEKAEPADEKKPDRDKKVTPKKLTKKTDSEQN